MITFSTATGRRNWNEDRVMWVGVPGGVLLGVFDGHGGDFVAEVIGVIEEYFEK